MELDDSEEITFEGIEDLWPEYEEGSDDLFFSEDDDMYDNWSPKHRYHERPDSWTIWAFFIG